MDEDIEEAEGFGLRGLIDSERGNHSASDSKLGVELIEEMDVLNCVKDAIAHGETSVDIPFPEELQNIGMNDQYSGEIKWETVRENLRTLILAEEVGCEIHMKPLGLCCEKPAAKFFQRIEGGKSLRVVICKSCKKKLSSSEFANPWRRTVSFKIIKGPSINKKQRDAIRKGHYRSKTDLRFRWFLLQKSKIGNFWENEDPNDSEVIAYICTNCQEYLSENPYDHALERLTIIFLKNYYIEILNLNNRQSPFQIHGEELA